MTSGRVKEVESMVGRHMVTDGELDLAELVSWWNARGHNRDKATWTTTMLLEILYLNSMKDERVKNPVRTWIDGRDVWDGREVAVEKINSVLSAGALTNMVYWRQYEVWSGPLRVEDMDWVVSWPSELAKHKDEIGVLKPRGNDLFLWFSHGMLGAMNELASKIRFSPFDSLGWTERERMEVANIAWTYRLPAIE